MALSIRTGMRCDLYMTDDDGRSVSYPCRLVDYECDYDAVGRCEQRYTVVSNDLLVPRRTAVIDRVVFNDPATIVLWDDGTKTVVKCEGERFDPEKGLAMCIAKKALGNEGNYYNVFREHLPEERMTDTDRLAANNKEIAEKVARYMPKDFEGSIEIKLC